eukprot:SAG31_NODE_5907_length_2263_cov_1.661275_1_plen_80_part_00
MRAPPMLLFLPEANIIGTAERLAPEAIVYSHNSSGVREILLQVECRFFDDCTYRYHGIINSPQLCLLSRTVAIVAFGRA